MKFHELPSFLERHDVPEYLYSFGGLGTGECVGIANTNDGWEVYFSERGSKNNLRIHSSEEAAIDDFLARLNTSLQDFEGRSLIPEKKH